MTSERRPFAVVVNDDTSQLRTMTAILNRGGWTARGFSRADEALCFLAGTGSPDLIITDIYMPEIDGWRLCRLLRSPEYPHLNQTPVLVVSATYTTQEAGLIAAEIGADDFLPMPVDGSKLLETAGILLHRAKPARRSRILIVDDSPSIVHLLTYAFETVGYEVDIAGSAEEAEILLRNREYDVAVIDYHLPGAFGDTLLQPQTRRAPDCVCIMMTSDPRPELALAWMRSGAAAYARKPFDAGYMVELCFKTRRERALLRVEDLLKERTRDLRENRSFLQAILNSIQDGILVLDADLTVRYANPVMERWRTAGESIEGRRCPLCDRLPDSNAGGCTAVRCLKSGHVESAILPSDSIPGVAWLEVFSYPIRSPETGAITGVVEFVRDITERRRNEERIRRLATTDELTGVHNRRHFIERAEVELSRSMRYRDPLSLFILDIDHFKSVNDTHGHDAGDKMLREVARTCKHALRDADLFCRWGGEEFAGLLIRTSPSDAVKTAERLREAVADISVSYGDAWLRVTVSIGITHTETCKEDLDDLMKRADDALYLAKSGGRNRVLSGR